MRTFIAITLPKEIKDSLSGILETLKATQADVKWVAPANIHLTLKFLGEIDDKKIQEIAEIMEIVAKNKPAFTMSASSLGAFPKPDYPRVIWLGLDKGAQEAKEIAEDLEENIAKLGIPKETRPFSSHITLGRLRSPAKKGRLIQELQNPIGILKGNNLEFSVTQITLFKSTLTPSGPVYQALKTASLKTI